MSQKISSLLCATACSVWGNGWGGASDNADVVTQNPTALSVAFATADPNAPNRTFVTQHYQVIVTGTSTEVAGVSTPNLTTVTFITYSGAGLPTGRGDATQPFGASATHYPLRDYSDLSQTVGHIGGMTWEEGGTKTIVATTFAFHNQSDYFCDCDTYRNNQRHSCLCAYE